MAPPNSISGLPTSIPAHTIVGQKPDGTGQTVQCDASGNLLITSSAANIPVIDASVGADNSTAPLFSTAVGWEDANGKLQVVSAANPLPTSGGGSGGGNVTVVGPVGQALAAASIPVVLTAAQVTTLTPPPAITNFANETGGNLATVAARIPALGQALAAASVPVVLTAAQISTLTPPAVFGGVVTNAGTFAVQASQATAANLLCTASIASAQTLATVTTVGTVTTVTNAVKIVGNAGATLDAAVGTLPTNNQAVISCPTSGSGGALSASLKSAQATAVNIKASAGNLYGLAIVSATATAGFIMFFNTATTATSGAVWAIPIAASGTVIIPPGALALLNFSTGIAINVATPLNGTTTQITWTGTVMYL